MFLDSEDRVAAPDTGNIIGPLNGCVLGGRGNGGNG